MKTTHIPPLLLSIALQFAPICRAIQSTATLPQSPLSAIFRWFAPAAVTLGSVDAVSGASAPVVILSPTTATATNGTPFLYLITQSSTYTDIGHLFEASPLPAGLSVRTIEGNSLPAFGIISGTPSESGFFQVTLKARFANDHHPNEPYPTTNLFLTILGPPSIQVQPAGQTVQGGSVATFTVTANAAPTPAYQWRRNNQPLLNQTNSTLILDPVVPLDAGDYDVVISNSYGSITSSPPAQLSVDSTTSPIVIVKHPSSIKVFEGQPFQLNMEATGSGQLIYEWFKDGASQSTTSGPNLIKAAAQSSDTGAYKVKVSNLEAPAGIFSDESTVQVLSIPVISQIHTAKGMVHMEFHSLPGATYQVEYIDSLSEENWASLGSPVSPEIPTHQRITDPSPSPTRYYRLKVVIP